MMNVIAMTLVALHADPGRSFSWTGQIIGYLLVAIGACSALYYCHQSQEADSFAHPV